MTEYAYIDLRLTIHSVEQHKT